VPWNQVDNDDNGSLFTGELRLQKGDLIQVQGESSPRRVTYIMGSDRKGWRVCTRGCGAFPCGPVRWMAVNDQDEVPQLTTAPTFSRYIGIDYAGAQTPTSSLKGLRVYMADQVSSPVEVQPPPSPRKYWTRRGIAEWLVERLAENRPTLVGVDHGFSFPLRYFETHGLPQDWPAFLDDFRHHWPTDEDDTYVDFVREGVCGNGAVRLGDARWRRLTEVRAGAAKSVFHFDVQGSVAKSTHAGLPWLLYLRRQLGGRVHFWPFDGWDIPAGRSVIAEVYPSLWSRSFAREGRNHDQHDAYSVAAWMRRADLDGSLAEFLRPDLAPGEREVAQIEGWILGIK